MKNFVLSSIVFALFLNRGFAQDETVDLDKIVVEASRSNDTAGQMNQSVTIITSDEIAKSPAKNLMELLATVPGANSVQLSNVKNQQVDLGGFGESSISNALILVDGRRLNQIDLSAPDLSQIDLGSIDHIEIIQGTGTVLYGDNAVGGVINIITRKGKENSKPAISLSSEADSYKGNKDGMGISGGLPKLAYQFNYDRDQNGGYRTHSDYWANDFSSHSDYNPTDIFGVDFTQDFHIDRYRLPGGLTIDEINQGGPTGTGTLYSDYFEDFGSTSDSHFDLTPHLKLDFGPSTAVFTLFTSERKDDNKSAYNYFGTQYDTNYNTQSYEFQPKVVVAIPLTDRLENKVTSGYDYFYSKEKRTSTDLVDTTQQDISFPSKVTHGVYLLDELTLDERWLLNAGVRGAWAKYVYDQTEQIPSKVKSSDTTEGYEGGLGYKYNPNSKIFFNYNHSYRLPNIDELFQSSFVDQFGNIVPASVNPNLTYQSGNQYQLGIKDQSFKSLHLGFNVTTAQNKNEIYYDPNLFANMNYGGRTRHFSEEAEISSELFNGKLEPFANITFQQSYFYKGIYSGNKIPFVPNQIAHAGLTYHPFEWLSTSLMTDFTGKRYSVSDQANTHPQLKRFDTVDWNIKFTYRDIELWFSLRNIFDTRYYSYGTYGLYYYPSPGRNAEAGIKVKF